MRLCSWKDFIVVFTSSLLLTQKVFTVKEMLICFVFYEYLGAAEKKNSVVFFSISLECVNNALFGKETARGLEFGLFANAKHGCLSVRSLESWNCCKCTSCTWLPFLIGQLCSQVWCRLHLATNFGFFECFMLTKLSWSMYILHLHTQSGFQIHLDYTWEL